MKTVKVGVIGAGAIARDHIRGCRLHPGAEVVAVADANSERAETVAREFSVPRVYKQARDVFRQTDIDAVTLAVPNRYHARYALAALQAGKHVSIDKPFTLNAKEAQQLVAAAHVIPLLLGKPPLAQEKLVEQPRVLVGQQIAGGAHDGHLPPITPLVPHRPQPRPPVGQRRHPTGGGQQRQAEGGKHVPFLAARFLAGDVLDLLLDAGKPPRQTAPLLAILCLGQTALQLIEVGDGQAVDHAKSSGRIAFACKSVKPIYKRVKASGDAVQTPPLTLPTPGKVCACMIELCGIVSHLTQ